MVMLFFMFIMLFIVMPVVPQAGGGGAPGAADAVVAAAAGRAAGSPGGIHAGVCCRWEFQAGSAARAGSVSGVQVDGPGPGGRMPGGYSRTRRSPRGCQLDGAGGFMVNRPGASRNSSRLDASHADAAP